MGILDLFRLSSRKEPEAATPARPRAYGEFNEFLDLQDPRLADFVRGGSETAAGYHVTEDSAMRVAAVYGCVRLISGAVATLPLDVKRRVGPNREDAEDFPLWNVLRRRPNAWMKPAQFRRMLQAHILLRGNAYSLKVLNFRGEVTALLPLHPDRVKPKQLPDLTIEYEYQPPVGGSRKLEQSEVFHLMGMTQDGVKGISVLSYARETVGLALATARHGASFFKNGTHVGSILKHPGKLGTEGQDTLRESLGKYRQGGQNEQKTLVLEEGMDFQSLGMTAQDAQFVETMGLTRTEIGMFFGVPPHLIGDTEKNTSWGTGIEAQTRGFVAFTLEDWLTAWEESINADLIGDKNLDIYARFNRAALVRGDIKSRWDAYVKALQWGVYSPNHVLALEDENPRADGKGDVYYEPPNTAGGGAAAAGEGNQNDASQAA